MMQLEFYAKTPLTWSGEIIVQSDKLSAAELQKRMIADDQIWRRGRFRKAKKREPATVRDDYSFFF